MVTYCAEETNISVEVTLHYKVSIKGGRKKEEEKNTLEYQCWRIAIWFVFFVTRVAPCHMKCTGYSVYQNVISSHFFFYCSAVLRYCTGVFVLFYFV